MGYILKYRLYDEPYKVLEKKFLTRIGAKLFIWITRQDHTFNWWEIRKPIKDDAGNVFPALVEDMTHSNKDLWK